MEVRIENKKTEDGFKACIGQRYIELMSRIGKKLDDEELATSQKETVSILEHCGNPKSDKVHSVTELVVGYVQSGKTMSFTSVSALAHDNGFRVIVYFTGNKNNLLDQTTKRLKKDLLNKGTNRDFYKIHENPNNTDIDQICNELQRSSQPTILITVLKHNKYIDQLTSIFNAQRIKSILKNSGVLIIDDEADQASLNGYAYKNSKSEEWEEDEYTTTYSSILKLRSSLPNHSYIQYTATPQGPLLISLLDLLSPTHHVVLTPGKKYTGGKVFFKEEPELIREIPVKETYNSKQNDLKDPPKTLLDSLILHILAVVIIVCVLKKETYLSMMIHADKDQDASEKFHKWVQNILNTWIDIFELDDGDIAKESLIDEFKRMYPESIREYKKHNETYPTFEEILPYISDTIKDTNLELLISRNKKNNENKEIDWEAYPSHILIGAEMLNRGFTVENLATTYMPRYTTGKTNADTIQQRCRFFGYKRNYLWSCRVFLPNDVKTEYTEYVESEEEMRKWLKECKSLEDVQHLLLLSPKLNATRKNILSKDVVQTKLTKWRNMNAFQEFTIPENTELVENFISSHASAFKEYTPYGTEDRDHRYIKLPIDEAINFLTDFKFQNMPDAARKQATIRYLKYLKDKDTEPLNFVYIVQMAYKKAYRERGFDPQTEKLSSQLFAGRSTKGTDTYPGDGDIKFEDSLTFQIHHLKFDCPESFKWNGKEAYTLAIYYPEDFAVNYVGSNK